MRQIAATRRGDKSPRLHCCCDKSLALSLSLRYVAQIQTSLNLCDRSQRQNSVAATMIFTCHTRRFVAATCRGTCRSDFSQRFVASCVSAFIFYFASAVFRCLSNDIALKGFVLQHCVVFFFILRCDSDFWTVFCEGLFSAWFCCYRTGKVCGSIFLV